jgi:poly(ADP-ribose) glycohydrolase ARH3
VGEIVLYKARRGLIRKDDQSAWIGKDDLLQFLDEFPQYKYTDDTAMAIGIAECLIARHGIEPQYLGDRFRWNLNNEPWRGYGNGPAMIFLSVQLHRLSYEAAAKKVGEVVHGGQGSAGNGAAMRATPIGLYYRDGSDLYTRAETSAVVTHTHPIGIDGAAIVAKAVATAVAMARRSFSAEHFCQELIDFARTQEMKDRLNTVRKVLRSDVSPDRAADELGRGETAHESVPFAVYSFLRQPLSFRDCLYTAVLNGGDCDTLGAMACGISGAFLGIKAIPREWTAKLENRKYLQQLAGLMSNITGGRTDIPLESSLRRRWQEQNDHLDDEFVEELTEAIEE